MSKGKQGNLWKIDPEKTARDRGRREGWLIDVRYPNIAARQEGKHAAGEEESKEEARLQHAHGLQTS